MLNKEIRELLPERLRGLVERVVLKEEKLQEIRIRREKGIALRYDGRFVVPEQKQKCYDGGMERVDFANQQTVIVCF